MKSWQSVGRGRMGWIGPQQGETEWVRQPDALGARFEGLIEMG